MAYLNFYLYFWPHHMVRGISVPHLGIEPRPPAMEAWTQPLGHQGCPSRAFLEARPGLKWQSIVL